MLPFDGCLAENLQLLLMLKQPASSSVVLSMHMSPARLDGAPRCLAAANSAAARARCPGQVNLKLCMSLKFSEPLQL